MNSLGSFLTPVVAFNSGIVGLFVVRFFMGALMGFLMPAVGGLLARWFPAEERATALAIYTCGNQISHFLIMPLSAWLCQQTQWSGGWPTIFYLSGVFGVACSLLWGCVMADDPQKSRWISQAELEYISEDTNFNLQCRKAATRRRAIPWRDMLSSKPLWAVLINNFSCQVFTVILMVYIPTYLKDAIRLDLNSNGLYSALPFAVLLVVKMGMAHVAQILKKNGRLSHTTVTKIFNSISAFGSAAFSLLLCLATCDRPWLALLSLCLATGALGGATVGYFTSQISIAPQYAGMVASLSRIAGQLASIATPYLVGWLTPDGTAAQWRHVYFTSAALMAAAGLVFLLFGSDDVQFWALPPSSKASIAEKKLTSASLLRAEELLVKEEQEKA